MLQLHPLHAHDPWWPLILGYIHQEPSWATYSPSGRHIRDAVALTRCSRGTAGRLVFPYGTHFVQAERVAAIYHHCHEWMDANRPFFHLPDGTSEGEALLDPLIENADFHPCPFSPWSDGA